MRLATVMGLVIEDVHHDQVDWLGHLDAFGGDVGEVVFKKAVVYRLRPLNDAFIHGRACVFVG